MRTNWPKCWIVVFVCGLVASGIFGWQSAPLWAQNIAQYRDTISASAPLASANHTLEFVMQTPVLPGGSFEVRFPEAFEVINSPQFSPNRNVQLFVNGVERVSSDTLSGTSDRVEIVPGSGGVIRYTLNTIEGIAADDMLQLRIGNNTTKSLVAATVYDEDLATTTEIIGDIPGVINASTTGTHRIDVRAYDPGPTQIARASFLVAMIEAVGVGPADTTEDIPPDRFNGDPSGVISGVSLFVEISLETDEFSNCRYSTTPDTAYAAMTNNFDNTGLIFHSTVVPVVPGEISRFYVRCMDDEFNINTDDFEIMFQVNAVPTGESNEEGDVEGDGTGTGNEGSGDGGGSGGQTGQSSGEQPTTGGSSGTGGSGGGGGGGSGASSGGGGGGGFEATPGPYRSGDGEVTITGLASPRSRVYVIVDGKAATDAVANAQGEFEIVLREIARGPYTFGIYAIDTAGTKSSTFSTSFSVAGARASTLSNVTIPPSLKVTPDPVDPGQALTISGFTVPNATVTLQNEKEGSAASRTEFTATAGANGAWSVTVPTNSFTTGTYKARARAQVSQLLTTSYSSYTLYGVGQAANRPLNTDLNRDGKVNLVDFSILLFWWGTAGGDSDPPADINSDSRVNLTDFSILLFNWTG